MRTRAHGRSLAGWIGWLSRGGGVGRAAMLVVVCAGWAVTTPAGAAEEIRGGSPATLKATAKRIRQIATQPNASAKRPHPLPLFGYWQARARRAAVSPRRQLDLIANGYHLLPWFKMPSPGQRRPGRHYGVPLTRCAKLKLPISFISTQWEALMMKQRRFKALPAKHNPQVITPNGEIRSQLSPFGPKAAWRAAGALWTTSDVMRQLQKWYPDPPFVLFVSNNEANRLRWRELNESARYLSKYGKGRSKAFKKQLVGDHWIERYRALQAGMRDGLAAKAWRQHAKFIGYKAVFPRPAGRYTHWEKLALVTPDRLDPSPLAWDGGSAPFYLNHSRPITDFKVYSPQVEAMNWVPFKRFALEVNPAFWFEMSTFSGSMWDEPKAKHRAMSMPGNPFDATRYQAAVQFGMWVARPRLVRGFGFKHYEDKRLSPFFKAVLNPVEAVHRSSTLQAFWKHGRLVANPHGDHPYDRALPDIVKQKQRWYLLEAEANPPRPWKLEQKLAVFALSRVIGESPKRRWLVYAHGPLGSLAQTRLHVPGYGVIRVDVPRQGAFYLVKEQSERVKRVPLNLPFALNGK